MLLMFGSIYLSLNMIILLANDKNTESNKDGIPVKGHRVKWKLKHILVFLQILIALLVMSQMNLLVRSWADAMNKLRYVHVIKTDNVVHYDNHLQLYQL